MWIFQYLRLLAIAYEKTLELTKELRSVGSGDLDVEGKFLSFFFIVVLNIETFVYLFMFGLEGFETPLHHS